MSRSGYFTSETFDFLSELAENNDREWFTANKPRYEAEVKEPALRLIRDLADPLRALSPYFQATPRSLFRIYRDTRFSRDKRPYKTHIGIHIRHVDSKEAHGAPSYYFHVQPGSVFVGLGLWHPEREALGAIRDRIAEKPEAWRRASRDPAFRENFELFGERLKRPPQGYPADHPEVEDLKLKDFVGMRPVPDSFATREDLAAELGRSWGTGSPFMRFLCDAVGVPFA